MNILVIGGGAREHAICKAVYRSKNNKLFCLMSNKNPGIEKICEVVSINKETDTNAVVYFAEKHDIDMALIGPEAPLQKGLSDILIKKGFSVCAPSKDAARIETDKEWMRNLLKKHKINGQLITECFIDSKKAIRFIEELHGDVAIKPIGLTGGKGVKVSGDHFNTMDEAEEYIQEILQNEIGGQAKVLIEEKAIGEEFTLQAFSDGIIILPLPLVQDHKRLKPGDEGPNTGGMGSYSSKDGLLPFVKKSDYEQSALILQHIVEALNKENCPYIGPIYGQFMLTNDGPKIIEINARFGDPEAMNVLPLINNDYITLCKSMLDKSLHQQKLDIKKLATVCKYIVPEGYGVKSMIGEKIDVDESLIEKSGSLLFYASVNKKDDHITTTSSRSLAIVGLADNISDAEKTCEEGLKAVKSDHIFIRHDIGRKALIEKRVTHMKKIRGM
ncbi:phosphoribosylamine--glycine ligase [Thermoplasmatales archaeon ex4572_165]|nr:MAG: phosphoribosylamine--glycine ligase [Thermoplasmatales archaeon ex4572_165]RLF59824.1 MAG: phosphoribosylamine--glycine ligase [Thermoplasmata archaeon]